MDLSYEIWPVEGGYGYTVFDAGVAWIVQPHDPYESGFAVMTESRAKDAAESVIAGILTQSAE
jgi:hypothetical protein